MLPKHKQLYKKYLDQRLRKQAFSTWTFSWCNRHISLCNSKVLSFGYLPHLEVKQSHRVTNWFLQLSAGQMHKYGLVQCCTGYLSWSTGRVVWSKPSHGSSPRLYCLSFCLWWDDMLRGGGRSFITVYLLHAWTILKLCVGQTPAETGRGTTVSSVNNTNITSRGTNRFRTIIWVTC